jgi:hypothetical protein
MLFLSFSMVYCMFGCIELNSFSVSSVYFLPQDGRTIETFYFYFFYLQFEPAIKIYIL